MDQISVRKAHPSLEFYSYNARKFNFSPCTTRELLQDLSGEGEDSADTATPPLGSPQKNLKLKLGNELSNMGMVLLSDKAREKITFDGNKLMFLDTLDKKGWLEFFLSKFDQKLERKIEVDEFKEELWDTVVKFGEPILLPTGQDENAREELPSEMVHMRETRTNIDPKPCKNSSTLKQKNESKKFKTESDDKDKPNSIAKDINIPKTREEGCKSRMKRVWI